MGKLSKKDYEELLLPLQEELVAMARYAASMYGEASPGYEEATRLLGLPS